MPAFASDPEEKRARRQGVVALVFCGLAVVILYLPVPQQQQVARTLRASVLRPFIATQSIVARARLRTSEVGRLQEEVDSLVAALMSRSGLAEENSRLRALLRLSGRLDGEYRAANVLRSGTGGSESTFLVDVGRRQGVRKGAPVIMEDGLVGVVREVSGESSIGMDWTHPDFRASAMSVDGEAYGIVEPRRGDFREEDRLILTGTPYHTRLDTGTVVVTSGRGGIYPRGIPIGTVEGLAGAEGGWRKSYWIRPAVRAGEVAHVLVAAAGEGLPPEEMSEAMLGRPDSASGTDGAEAGPARDGGPPRGREGR